MARCVECRPLQEACKSSQLASQPPTSPTGDKIDDNMMRAAPAAAGNCPNSRELIEDGLNVGWATNGHMPSSY